MARAEDEMKKREEEYEKCKEELEKVLKLKKELEVGSIFRQDSTSRMWFWKPNVTLLCMMWMTCFSASGTERDVRGVLLISGAERDAAASEERPVPAAAV